MEVVISGNAPDATRARLLAAAQRQFAARGFYGASIARIAGEVGLTKQALLYHFRRKEDIYTQVLKGIAERMLEGMRTGIDPDRSAAEQFEDMVLGIYQTALDHPLDVQVLMRELLDQQRREAPRSEWFFLTFIDEIVAVLGRVDAVADLSVGEKRARVYLILSAIEYYAGSGDLLERFYGEDGAAEIARAYPAELRALVNRLMAGSH